MYFIEYPFSFILFALSVGYLLIHYRTRQESDIYCSKVFNNALRYLLLFNLATYKLTIFYILHQVSVINSIRTADFLSTNKLLVWNTMRQLFASVRTCRNVINAITNATDKMNEKSARRRGKHCELVEPKIVAPLQTPFPGTRDGQNLISWRWSLPLPTNPVW